MGGKGILRSVLILSLLSLFLLVVNAFAADICYDSFTGTCTGQVNNVCPGTTIDMTSNPGACVPAGCCCYKDTVNSGLLNQILVNSAVCTNDTAYDTPFTRKPVTFWKTFAGEDTQNCQTLCARGPGTESVCGNSVCEVGETCSVCSSDCGVCPPLPTDCTGEINGLVTSADGYPSVLVVYTKINGVPSSSALVNPDRTFRITGVCSGVNTLDISSGPYMVVSSPSITISTPNQVVSGQTLQIALRNVAKLTGRVVSLVGMVATPIPGAIVRVRGLPYATLTNSLGEFSFNLTYTDGRPLSVSLYTTKDTYLSQTTLVVLSPTTTPPYATFVQINLTTVGSCIGSPVAPTWAAVDQAVSYTKGKRELKVTWLMATCAAAVDTYNVERCTGLSSGTGATCTATSGNFASIGFSNSLSFTDSTIDWGTNYTYRVTAVYPGAILKPSALLSPVYSGDLACEDNPSTTAFCSSVTKLEGGTPTTKDVVQSCDQKNKLAITECTTSAPLCALKASPETGEISARCTIVNPCTVTSSSNPFGLYFTTQSCVNQVGGSCYFDKNLSNVNSCLNCKVGMKCTDYRTSQACGLASCGTLNCAWEDIDPVLGIGICANTKKAACSDCADPLKTPFGVCDTLTCAALGSATDKCFYSESKTCQSCTATRCGDYKSSATCENGRSTGLSPANNAFTSKSADACEIGVCRWDASGGLCIKDSNADVQNDCPPLIYDSASLLAKCNLDRTPPVTFVVVPETFNPLRTNVTIKFIAQDKGAVGQDQVRMTRVCIARATDMTACDSVSKFAIVPFLTATGRTVNLTDGNVLVPARSLFGINAPALSLAISEGAYVVNYYSVDGAWNIEEVKSTVFNVNTTPPQITLTTTVLKNANILLSDVLAVVTSNVAVKCAINFGLLSSLTLIEDPITSTNFATEQQVLFTGKSDGAWGVKATCADASGSARVAINPVTLEADSRIFNIQPSGFVNTTSPFVTFQTNLPVECRMTASAAKLATFSSMEYVFARFGPVNAKYNYSYQLQNLPQGSNTYYIACNFNSEYVPKVVGFTVDTIASNIKFENAAGDDFNFATWYAQNIPAVYVKCQKSTSTSSTCTGYEYCVAPYVFSLSANSQSVCEPKTLVTVTAPARGLLAFGIDDFSSQVCVRGIEVVGGQTRKGPISCKQVFVDKYAPTATFSSIPAVTNKNSLSVAGNVYDYTATFPNPIAFTASNGQFYSTLGAGKLNATNVFINGTILFSYDLASQSSVDFILRANSSSPVTVRIDATNANAVVLKILSGSTIVTSAPLTIFATTAVPWSIRASGTTVSVTIGSTTISGNVGVAAPGLVRFSTVNLGGQANARASISKIQYYDLDLASQNNLLLFSTVGDGQDTRSTQTVMSTIGAFNITVVLDTPQEVVEKRTYDLELYVQDQAGQKSSPTKRASVMFSLAGPTITNVTFVTSNVSQSDKTFIEMGSNATATIITSAQYGLTSGKIDVYYAGQTKSQPVSEPVASGLRNITFSTEGLPVGILDVGASVTDGTGTTTGPIVFEQKLRIKNTLDPRYNFSIAEIIYTNTTTPTLVGKVYDDSVVCTATYKAADNTTGPAATLTKSVDGYYRTLVVSRPLLASADELTESQILFTCSLLSKQWQTLVRVVIDKRPPVFGASLGPNIGMSLTSYDRTLKSYVSFAAVDKRLAIIADEAVTCKYGIVSNVAQPLDVIAFHSSLMNTMTLDNGSVALDDQIYKLIPFTNGQTINYGISCSDAAGNIAKTVRFVRVTTDVSGAPYIVSISPNKIFNQSSFTLIVNTTSDASCTATKAGGSAIPMPQIGQSVYEKSYGVASSVLGITNVYTVTVACVANGKTTSKQVIIPIDTVTPVVTFSPMIDLPEIIYTSSALANIDLSTLEAVTAIAMDSSTSRVYLIKSLVTGAGSLSIPVRVGYTYLDLQFIDAAGNSVTKNVIISRAYTNSSQSTQFVDALADSIGPAPQIINAQLFGDAALAANAIITATLTKISAPATLYTLTSSKVTVGSITNITFGVPALLDGTYYLSYSVAVDTNIVAADGAKFVVDSFAEPIVLQTFVNQSQRRNGGSYDLRLNVPYSNVILPGSDVSSWEGSSGVINRTFNKVKAPITLASNLLRHAFTYEFVNELGSGSLRVLNIATDPDPALISINLLTSAKTGANAAVTSVSPIAQFSVDSNEPVRLTGVTIKGPTGTSYSVNVIDYVYGQFATSFVIRSGERLPNSVSGQYTLELSAVDSFGNVAATKQFKFYVTITDLVIQLVSPKYGYSTSDSLNVVISTDRYAICNISKLTQTGSISWTGALTSSDKLNHTGPISGLLENVLTNFSVSCVEDGTTAPVVRKIFAFGKQSNPPQITSVVIMNSVNGSDGIPVVSDPLGVANINVTTSIPAYCKYVLTFASAATSFAQMTPFNPNSSLSLRNIMSLTDLSSGNSYSYVIQCANGADVTSERTTVNFKVNFAQVGLVTITSPTARAYSTVSTTATIPVSFSLTRAAGQGCYWGRSDPPTTSISPLVSTSGLLYNVSPAPTFNIGVNNIYVLCNFDGEMGSTVPEKRSVQFSVDNSKPIAIRVIAPANTTRLTNIPDVQFVFQDNESQIAMYEYVVGTAKYPTVGWNITKGITQSVESTLDIVVQIVLNNTYYVTARAINGAGDKSDWISSNGTRVIRGNVIDDDQTPPVAVAVYTPINTSFLNKISPVRFDFRDPESGVVSYQYVVGTAQSGQSGWDNAKAITNSSAAIFDITGLTLVEGRLYYVTARAINGAGDKSVWLSSNATRVLTGSVIDPNVSTDDTTPPVPFAVYTPVNTSYLNRIANVRFDFRDAESNVISYQYVVGTARYGQTGWNATKGIATTTSSSVTISNLALVAGQSYYVTARAINSVGNISTWLSSNATRVLTGAIIDTNDSDDDGDGGNESVLVTVTLPNGTIIIYPNGTRTVVTDGTRIRVTSGIANQLKSGTTTRLVTGGTLLTLNGQSLTLPPNTTITIPEGKTVTIVNNNTMPPLPGNRPSPINKTGSGNSPNPYTNGTGENIEDIETGGFFSTGVIWFLIALLLVGGFVAGYVVYTKKQQEARRPRESSTPFYSSEPSSNRYEETMIAPKQASLQDKLKVALEARVKKQRNDTVVDKKSQLFSAFDRKEDLIKKTLAEPKIGVFKTDEDAKSSEPKSTDVTETKSGATASDESSKSKTDSKKSDDSKADKVKVETVKSDAIIPAEATKDSKKSSDSADDSSDVSKLTARAQATLDKLKAVAQAKSKADGSKGVSVVKPSSVSSNNPRFTSTASKGSPTKSAEASKATVSAEIEKKTVSSKSSSESSSTKTSSDAVKTKSSSKK